MRHSRRNAAKQTTLLVLELELTEDGEHQAVRVVESLHGKDDVTEKAWRISAGSPTAGQCVDIAVYCEEEVYHALLMHLGAQGVLPT